MAIPASFIQELLARVDVVELVGRYVQLKKGGANFMGLCPFHGEKSPSFSVSPTKQFYHCFGCGKHGDAINFLMEQTGMSFVEAVRDLAQHYGLQVPEDEASPQDRARAAEQRQKQATLNDVLEKAGEAYRKQLRQSPKAIAYLKKRGLSGEVARDFGLGYAPEGWRSLASVFASYDDPLLVESGLVIHNEEDGAEAKRYDRFRDRIMFPIRNVKGECIGFGGRVLGDEKPKYLNSPETPVFSKGHELYGLYEARNAIRDAGYVLVTEGYMDVVALAQLGFPQAVATLGTACTTDHVQKLFRFTDTVVFSFDGDAAGRRAARRALDGALPYASDVRSVKFLFLPPEHDPDSYIREHGRDAFAGCVREAVPLSRFLLEAAGEDCDLSLAEGRARYANQARPLWNALPDGALKRQLIADIASRVQLDTQDLLDLWSLPAGGARGGSGPARAGAAHTGREGGAGAAPGRTDREGQTSSPRRGAWRSDAAGGWPGKGSAQRMPARARAGVSRADKVTRVLLVHSHLWERLSPDEHVRLCGLPEPHGGLLRWLEAQLHEQGPLPWGVLNEALNDAVRHQYGERPDPTPPSGPSPADPEATLRLARQLMQDEALRPGEDANEALSELRNLLTALHIDALKAEESAAMAALQAAPDDREAQQRYRDLHARRLALQAAPWP